MFIKALLKSAYVHLSVCTLYNYSSYSDYL